MRKGKFRNVKELYGSNGETLEPKGTERGHGQRDYPNFDLKEEFRTCCICDTSCCMHSRRVKSPMGTKAGEFSDACQGKDVNGHSLDDADLLLPSLGCTRIRRHHTGSETSSLVNVCSSSFLENVESKACLRASATSEDTRQKVAENNSFAGASKFDNDKICSNQHKHQKESECLGNNISSMSELCHRNVVACNHDGNMEMKNESCSAASVNSFPVIETSVNVEPASCYMLNSVSGKVDNNDRCKREEFTNESPQAIAVCSSKSELSEISSSRVSSSEPGSLKGEPSKCAEEQLESSLIRVLRVCGQMKNVNNYAECINSDTELNGRIPAVEERCPDQEKDFEKPVAKVEEPNRGDPPLQSQLLDNSNESDGAEFEVKVCDICGDAGREDLLANCSKCSDGAEHIYCMRVKLDKIPEGDWTCEACILTEETRKHMQDKLEHSVASVSSVSSQSSLHRTKKNVGSSSVHKYKNSHLKKVLSVERMRSSKVKSNPCFSSKRSAGCLEAVPVVERRVFESIKHSRFSRPLKKTCLNSSFEDFIEGEIKQTLDLNISVDHLSDQTLGVGDRSHKLQPEYQISQGSPLESESFKIMDSKGTVLPMEGGVLKQNCSRETAVVNNKEARGVERMMKSMSFSNSIPNHRNASDSTVVNCHSNFSHGENLKRLKCAKEQSSTDSECTSKIHNPLVSSLVVGAGVNVLMTDDKGARGKIIPPLSSGSIYPGLEDGQNTIKSNEKLPWVLAIPSTISVVPQLNYRWKGEFEIQGGGGLARTCNGIQAHLSTCSSPKVLDIAQKLPQKILLEEVPRLKKWPAQFLKNHATEDNIALYFFACDVESYERGYKDLLECMIKNDLSLKGNVDELELLIFPSNLLPENSQCWNKKLFLWGVLRGRRVNCLSEQPVLQQAICICSRNEDQPNKNRHLSDFPFFGSQNLCSAAHSNESLSADSLSYNVHQRTKSFTLIEPLASGRMDEIRGSKELSIEDRLVNLQTSLVIQDSRVYSAKTEQARNMLHMDSFEREERDSTRGRIFHRFVKTESECNMDSARVDEERENKRFKSCFNRKDEVNFSKEMKYMGETFSTGINILGSTFTSMNHISNRADDVPISSTNFAPNCSWTGFKSLQQQVVLHDGSYHLDSRFPDLELSLGVRNKPVKQRLMPLFGADNREHMPDKYSKKLVSAKRDEGESSIHLSLSLNLPFSGREQVLNPYSETQLWLPEWSGVNTSLSL